MRQRACRNQLVVTGRGALALFVEQRGIHVATPDLAHHDASGKTGLAAAERNARLGPAVQIAARHIT